MSDLYIKGDTMAVWKSVGEKKLYGIGTCFQYFILFFRLFSFTCVILDVEYDCAYMTLPNECIEYQKKTNQHIFVAVRISIGLRIQKAFFSASFRSVWAIEPRHREGERGRIKERDDKAK